MSQLATTLGSLKVEINRRDAQGTSSGDGSVYARITDRDNNCVYLEERDVDEIRLLIRKLRRISSR